MSICCIVLCYGSSVHAIYQHLHQIETIHICISVYLYLYIDCMEGQTKSGEVWIQYKNKIIKLGTDWAEVTQKLKLEFADQQQLLVSIQLCLIDRLKHVFPISDSDIKAAVSKYRQAFSNS